MIFCNVEISLLRKISSHVSLCGLFANDLRLLFKELGVRFVYFFVCLFVFFVPFHLSSLPVAHVNDAQEDSRYGGQY